jgi:F1F0 ATPase subunit 2
MMNEALILGLVGVAGLFLGVIFFGGLWWTVSKGMASPRPALWFIGSLVLRTGIVLAGLYVIAGGAWQRMLMCLLGFVVARFIVTWLAPPPIASPRVRTAEAHHAP